MTNEERHKRLEQIKIALITLDNKSTLRHADYLEMDMLKRERRKLEMDIVRARAVMVASCLGSVPFYAAMAAQHGDATYTNHIRDRLRDALAALDDKPAQDEALGALDVI